MAKLIEHYHKNIPGWASFGQLYLDMVKRAPLNKPSLFVEIGSWMGRSAVLMAVEINNTRKPIEFHCVDPWEDGGPDLRHGADKLREPLFDTFSRNIGPVKHLIKAKKMLSLDAVKDYADGSIDFLMIDGSHVYEDVIEDMRQWWPKMKSGGTFSGDDYNWGGVNRAVKEFFDDKNVNVHIQEKPKKQHLKKAPAYWWTLVP